MATTLLSRTATAGSGTISTFSAWVKRSNVGTDQAIFSSSNGSNWFKIWFHSGDYLRIDSFNGSSWLLLKTTTRLFRDTSGYYNIVVIIDTTDGVAEDRMKLYINGVRETSFSTAGGSDTNAGSSDDLYLNTVGYTQRVGANQSGSDYYEGLMTHVQWVDATAVAATEFGQVDATSGIWKIKTACYATPGTNGFCLQMETTTGSAMGTDSSGEGNNLTEGGSPTQTIDNPSNVLATLNRLTTGKGVIPADWTISQGENTIDFGTTTDWGQGIAATLGASKGKWYWEIEYDNTADWSISGILPDYEIWRCAKGSAAGVYGYGNATQTEVAGYNCTRYNLVTTNDTFTFPSYVTDGKIISYAMDLDNNKLWMGLDGVFEGGGDPVAGTDATWSGTDMPSGTTWLPYCQAYYSASTNVIMKCNFGNGYFGTTQVSSAGTSSTDDDSIWEYDCPTGFYGLNTKNLNTYG